MPSLATSIAQRAPLSRPPLAGGAAALAARRYRDADLGQRIAAASPHELVTMLFDGGSTALTHAARAVAGGDSAARLRLVTRALAILDALDGALDHGRGGAVARSLAAAYAQVRALVVAGNAELRGELLTAAGDQLAELGHSWRAIVPRAMVAA